MSVYVPSYSPGSQLHLMVFLICLLDLGMPGNRVICSITGLDGPSYLQPGLIGNRPQGAP